MQQLAEYLFHEGRNFHSYDFLGSFLGDNECTFRVWAPNAQAVHLVGDFTQWEENEIPMVRNGSWCLGSFYNSTSSGRYL